jgi:16S rRNA (uracil1498-N3)-methyltransferase
MNMLIIDGVADDFELEASGTKARHIVRILKKGPGDELLAGCTDGRVGTARIEAQDGRVLRLRFTAHAAADSLLPIILLLGFPRPIQAKRIFKDLTSLGVAHIVLCGTELGEKSYIESDFFKHGEYRDALLEGAEQAANPRLPEVDSHWTLRRALDALDTRYGLPGERGAERCCLDPYRSELPLSAVASRARHAGRSPFILAIGSERGWTDAELALMAERGFCFATLGRRILKSETAAVAAVAVGMAGMGIL